MLDIIQLKDFELLFLEIESIAFTSLTHTKIIHELVNHFFYKNILFNYSICYKI